MLGSVIQLVRIDSRRSIYSGADMMPRARNGVSAEAEAEAAAGATATDMLPMVHSQVRPDSQLTTPVAVARCKKPQPPG